MHRSSPKMAKVGIVPGREFEMGKLDLVVAKALEQGATTGLVQIVAETQHRLADDFTGKYGTDYLFRAATGFVGLGPICSRMLSI
jgi:hypothetical protein